MFHVVEKVLTHRDMRDKREEWIQSFQKSSLYIYTGLYKVISDYNETAKKPLYDCLGWKLEKKYPVD